MPEGHLIHRYAREHGRRFAGAPVRVTSPQGRFATEARQVDGSPLTEVDAYGKHLFYRWASIVVHVHLGMQGRYVDRPPGAAPTAWARLRLSTDHDATELIAPSVCALLDEEGVHALVARLGPDPLRSDADEGVAIDAIRRSSRPVGAVLLDQAVISGLGNVLRAEVLFLAGIDPSRRGTDLSRSDAHRIWEIAVSVMRRARDLGRIVTVDGEPPENEARFVYKRDLCGRCGTPVETEELGQRTIYRCPHCQR